jgi:23S rRNA (uracil1939-C5)-methyltransferase
MEFAATKDAEGNVRLGLKARGRFDEIIPTPNCLLQSETGNAIRGFLEKFFSEKNLTVWNHKTFQGVLRYVVMRQSKTWDQFLLNIVVSEDQTALITELAEKVREEFPEVVSVYMSINSSPTDTAFNASPALISGQPMLEEVFKENLTFKISPQSFFQTNTIQAKVLYQTVVDLGGFKKDDLVFDLYCGTGTIGLYLAPHVKEVIGVEENPQAIEDAHKNARNNGIENMQFVTEKVKNFLKFTPLKPSVIVLDPPRSGNVPKALKRIIEMDAPKLVYVSCNPATLCRDLKEMCEAGYQISEFQPVDMFPNTYHVECIVVLHK